jgi:hypothetical protein
VPTVLDRSVLVANLKHAGRKILQGAVIYLVLSIVGGFSDRQSITLGTILFLVYGYVAEKLEEGIGREITPFSVTIHPNWYVLLRDNELIDDEKWKALNEELRTKNAGEYNVLSHGISFTVLPPVAAGFLPKGWPPGLIYSNNHHVFFSRTKLFRGIRESIQGLSTPWSHIELEAGGRMPLLYNSQFYIRLKEVRLNEVGLEIGLTTPESFKNSSEYKPDSDLVPVATMPPDVFECYYRPQAFDYASF